MTAIRFQQVEGAVRQLAAERPDAVVGCTYVDDGQPCCIMAHALVRLGVPTAVIAESCPRAIPGPNLVEEVSIAMLLRRLGVDMPYPQEQWLREVQRVQDQAVPWAKAVAEADREYPL